MAQLTFSIESWRIQALGLTASIALFFFIILLIKRRKLKEEYALLWLATTVFFSGLSIFKGSLDLIGSALGIYYAPAAVLLLLIGCIILILIHYSTVISKLSEQNQKLAQEIALLRNEINHANRHDDI